MAIAPNTRLGRYEILSLGEGGMGEVYLARDTQLGREVAVKVLPSSFSGNAERLSRFEQEACAAGALNHPNILAIHDVGTHDGSRIAFSTNRDGHMNLYQRAASGTGNDEALLKSDDRKFPNDWSDDGGFILYQNLDPKTNWDLWVLPLAADQKPIPFLQTEFDEVQGQFSPDGRWIAYTANESGTRQVYVRSFPASSGKWQVSTNGEAQPQWRRDGRELFYLSPDRKLMAVEVKGDGSTFEAGVPKALFELLRIPGPGSWNSYAATADGQRFLVTSLLEEATSTPTTVVLNWTADLKR
jgi:eukaryotic-like serine/threonine-protein kinase